MIRNEISDRFLYLDLFTFIQITGRITLELFIIKDITISIRKILKLVTHVLAESRCKNDLSKHADEHAMF